MYLRNNKKEEEKSASHITSPALQNKNNASSSSISSNNRLNNNYQLQQLANGSNAVQNLKKVQTLTQTVSNPIQKKENNTGLPDKLKTGIENLSGYAMDDVKVHYNSNKPAQLQAHAYAQGTNIHLASGQEKHLPHEAWHVVQQKQGRVKPSLQMKSSININDDPSLEKEAGEMGIKALSGKTTQLVGQINQKYVSTFNKAVVQREVFKVRKGLNSGKFYTDRDESRLFDTEEEAKAYQKTLIEARMSEKKEAEAVKKENRLKKRKQELVEKFPDYKAPETTTSRLFKEKDSAFDDVPVTELSATNAKEFMEVQMAKRRAGTFTSQVVNLGGFHHVMDPGSDIGLTPALNRPDLTEGHDFLPLSRVGKPKSYNALALHLDTIAAKYTKILKISLKSIRSRMGKDIDRITRGNAVKGEIRYTEEEQAILNEIAIVLRLDKGRVPKATKYIRGAITTGGVSFSDLFTRNHYVGAGTGGVKALRAKASVAEEDGEISEGSDIEEEEYTPQKKRATPTTGVRAIAHVLNFAEALERSWNPGDLMIVENFDEGHNVRIRWLKVHHGGLGFTKGDFRIELQGG
ncbi:MAG: DUF4157 domain-containing protein [Cellulophaga sp.]